MYRYRAGGRGAWSTVQGASQPGTQQAHLRGLRSPHRGQPGPQRLVGLMRLGHLAAEQAGRSGHRVVEARSKRLGFSLWEVRVDGGMTSHVSPTQGCAPSGGELLSHLWVSSTAPESRTGTEACSVTRRRWWWGGVLNEEASNTP